MIFFAPTYGVCYKDYAKDAQPRGDKEIIDPLVNIADRLIHGGLAKAVFHLNELDDDDDAGADDGDWQWKAKGQAFHMKFGHGVSLTLFGGKTLHRLVIKTRGDFGQESGKSVG